MLYRTCVLPDSVMRMLVFPCTALDQVLLTKLFNTGLVTHMSKAPTHSTNGGIGIVFSTSRVGWDRLRSNS